MLQVSLQHCCWALCQIAVEFNSQLGGFAWVVGDCFGHNDLESNRRYGPEEGTPFHVCVKFV